MSFHLGQKVVRVSGEDIEGVIAPAIGEIVTISDTYTRQTKHHGQQLCLAFREYPKHKVNGSTWWGFWACHFRPIVEKKTDISCFTTLLNTKEREREVA